MQDIGTATIVTDALPDLGFMFSPGIPPKDYGKDCIVHEFQEMVTDATKPIMNMAADVNDRDAPFREAVGKKHRADKEQRR